MQQRTSLHNEEAKNSLGRLVHWPLDTKKILDVLDIAMNNTKYDIKTMELLDLSSDRIPTNFMIEKYQKRTKSDFNKQHDRLDYV